MSAVLGLIFMFTAWIAAIVGWISNIYWLFAEATDTGVEFIIALVGVAVAPLGIIHGLIVLF